MGSHRLSASQHQRSKLHKSVRAHLRAEGFDFTASQEKLDKMLMRSLSAEARSALKHAWQLEGDTRLDALYGIPQTLRQASLLFSSDRGRVLASYEWLSEAITELPHGAVLDVGCGHGALTRHLARFFPQRRVIGIDAKSNLIAVARAASATYPNIEYVTGQYEEDLIEPGSVQVLASAVGIDLLHEPLAIDSEQLLPDRPYMPPDAMALMNQSAGAALSAWRRMASDNAVLLCIARLSDFTKLHTFVAAAAEAGWALDCDKSTYLRTSEERFPALWFVASAGNGAQPSEVGLFDWFVSTAQEQEADVDELAIVRYRRLRPVEFSQTFKAFRDGHRLKIEEGKAADGTRYRDEFATTGYRRLEIIK